MRTSTPSVIVNATVLSLSAVAFAGVVTVRPDAVVDLKTGEGVAAVAGQWRYADAHVVEVDHHAPGPDLKPSGAPIRTHDIHPRATDPEFDRAAWETIDPTTLGARRSTGRLSFGWYRLDFTVPPRIGALDTAGATIVLELVVDDYAEVWVDGRLPQVLGQSGGQLVAGWNTPNRVVITRDARPGQQVQLAVFAANGPLSDPPGNYIWIRSATLDCYAPGRLAAASAADVQIERMDPALDRIIPPDAKLEKLADGFAFTEGPVWVPAQVAGTGSQPIEQGYLLFSDPNMNVIYRWTADEGVSLFRTHSGYAGLDIGAYRQPGSNGLALDREGRLTICEHGNRRVTRVEKNGTVTVLADRFDGQRLNSPNDLIYRSDGALFFTDPFFGLPKFGDDPRKELPDTPIFCLTDGTLKKVSSDLKGPNGIAFSPDEKHLYVGNWDEQKKVVMRYDAAADGTLSNGTVFFDLTNAPGEEAIDGVDVDMLGNVYVSGPGGCWIVAPDGRTLGRVLGPELAANFAFGDEDGRTLYFAARTGLYRMRVNVAGMSAWRQR